MLKWVGGSTRRVWGFSSPVSWRHSLVLDVIFWQLFGIQEPVLPFISSGERGWRVRKWCGCFFEMSSGKG